VLEEAAPEEPVLPEFEVEGPVVETVPEGAVVDC
jgi:hypothetical protein